MRPALLWTATGLVALAELATAALILAPRVDPAYRAYFIERSSDCWPHKTDGHYALGTTVSFIYGARPDFTPNKICGWFYPGPQGTWSYGSYSLLRFRFAPAAGPLRLTLTAAGMVDAAHPVQRVAVSANGTPLGTLQFGAGAAAQSLTVPAALAATGDIELRFDYPDARPGTEIGPNEDSHLRAIRAVTLTLAPA